MYQYQNNISDFCSFKATEHLTLILYLTFLFEAI